MRILISIVVTIVVLILLTVILIKKSVNTENTQVNWTSLVQGNLTFNISMRLLSPFAVTITNMKLTLGAAGTAYFTATNPSLRLSPGLNLVSVTFVPSGNVSALGVAALLTQKKYLQMSGTVLGMTVQRTEYLN